MTQISADHVHGIAFGGESRSLTTIGSWPLAHVGSALSMDFKLLLKHKFNTSAPTHVGGEASR